MWVTLPLLIYFYECRLPCHHWCVVSKCRFSCLDWYVMTWNANYIAIIEILLNKLQIILPSLIYRYLFDECGLPFHYIFWESGLPCHCWYIVNKMQISLHVIFYGWMRIPCDHRYFTSGSGLPCHPRYFINDCRMPCHHRYFMSGSGLPCHPWLFQGSGILLFADHPAIIEIRWKDVDFPVLLNIFKKADCPAIF